MSFAKQLGISEQLLRLVDQAFDDALPILRRSGEPFNPFVLAEGGARPQLQRFSPETEQAVNAARVLIGRMPSEVVRYALVFDGRVTLDGEKHDAVLVEAGERESDFGVALALRYRPASARKGFEEVGNPKYLGRINNYFAQGADAEPGPDEQRG